LPFKFFHRESYALRLLAEDWVGVVPEGASDMLGRNSPKSGWWPMRFTLAGVSGLAQVSLPAAAE
jgi:hypothetical protein